MRRRYQTVLAITLVLAGVVSWAATRSGRADQTDPADVAQTDPAGKLIRATVCAASAYHVAPGDNATLMVENDGGWCWADTYETSHGHILFASSIAVTKPPRHGRVIVGDIDNQEVRIAYQPEPGFGGRDSFSIRYGAGDLDRTFLVAVSKPAIPAELDGQSVDTRTIPDSWAYLGAGGGYRNNASEQIVRRTKK